MKRIIGILLMILIALPGCNFLSPSDNSSTSSTEFVLKFQNMGLYAIRGLYITTDTIKDTTHDTLNWGSNILPVDSLDSLDYVYILHLKKRTTYSFKAVFDSVGTLVPLVFKQMVIGSIDTTSAYASKGQYYWGSGYDWGHQVTPGEHNVTP